MQREKAQQLPQNLHSGLESVPATRGPILQSKHVAESQAAQSQTGER